MDKNKENMLSAVRLWAVSQGMSEIQDEGYRYHIDLGFEKESKKIGFITEFDKDEQALEFKSVFARNMCDYVYIVTDDSRKRRELLGKIMPEYGILCYSDSFGLGFVYQVLKEPSLIK